jgi:hypothetical protein
MFIGSIPHQYCKGQTIEWINTIDGGSFKDLYDFLYVPLTSRTRKGLGYAFVNMFSLEHAERLIDVAQRTSRFTVSRSATQGLENILMKWLNSCSLLYCQSHPESWQYVRSSNTRGSIHPANVLTSVPWFIRRLSYTGGAIERTRPTNEKRQFHGPDSLARSAKLRRSTQDIDVVDPAFSPSATSTTVDREVTMSNIPTMSSILTMSNSYAIELPDMTESLSQGPSGWARTVDTRAEAPMLPRSYMDERQYYAEDLPRGPRYYSPQEAARSSSPYCQQPQKHGFEMSSSQSSWQVPRSDRREYPVPLQRHGAHSTDQDLGASSGEPPRWSQAAHTAPFSDSFLESVVVLGRFSC